MTLLVLGERDLPGLLPYPEVVAVMRQALAAHASGDAYQPLRSITRPPPIRLMKSRLRAHMAVALGSACLSIVPADSGGVSGNRAVAVPVFASAAAAIHVIRLPLAIICSFLARPDWRHPNAAA